MADSPKLYEKMEEKEPVAGTTAKLKKQIINRKEIWNRVAGCEGDVTSRGQNCTTRCSDSHNWSVPGGADNQGAATTAAVRIEKGFEFLANFDLQALWFPFASKWRKCEYYDSRKLCIFYGNRWKMIHWGLCMVVRYFVWGMSQHFFILDCWSALAALGPLCALKIWFFDA